MKTTGKEWKHFVNAQKWWPKGHLVDDLRTFFRKPHIKLNADTGKWEFKVFNRYGNSALANRAVWYEYNLLWDVDATRAFVARLNENKGV